MASVGVEADVTRAMQRYRGVVCGLVLAAADLLSAALAVACAIALRAGVRGDPLYPSAVEAAVGVWLALRFIQGLYPGDGLAPAEELRASVLTTVSAGLVHVAVLFAAKLGTSRMVALAAWLVLVMFGWFGRQVAKRALLSAGLYGSPVVVVGGGKAEGQVVEELLRHPEAGLRPEAVFSDDHPAGSDLSGVPVLGPVRLALNSKSPPRLQHAVVALPHLPAEESVRVAHALLGRYRTVTYLPGSASPAQLWVRPQSIGRYLMLQIRNNLADPVNAALKRFIDVMLGVPLLVLSAPVIFLCALSVWAVDRGPLFYFQEREGQGGRRIRVWKIRTMAKDAEARLQAILSCDPTAGEEWTRHMKLRRDPRVVPVVGALLRRLSLDELPQLWNVVRGEMSLVGPRPFPDYHLEKFPEEFRILRRTARPGITGLWQVTARSDADLIRQQEADTYYIRNWSLWLDAWILLRTPAAVLQRKGAY